jgi:hypothetical protein
MSDVYRQTDLDREWKLRKSEAPAALAKSSYSSGAGPGAEAEAGFG